MAEATLESLQEELAPYKGTLVLDYFEVVLLKDVIDGSDDFYWVYHNRRGTFYGSVLGRWVPLKGALPERDYKELVRVWNLNNNTENQAT